MPWTESPSSIAQQQCNQCGKQAYHRTDDVTSRYGPLHSLIWNHGLSSSNENKISDGWRDDASLQVEGGIS
jgi:hypothetical protein